MRVDSTCTAAATTATAESALPAAAIASAVASAAATAAAARSATPTPELRQAAGNFQQAGTVHASSPVVLGTAGLSSTAPSAVAPASSSTASAVDDSAAAAVAAPTATSTPADASAPAKRFRGGIFRARTTSCRPSNFWLNLARLTASGVFASTRIIQPAILHSSTWRGFNLPGSALEKVRHMPRFRFPLPREVCD